MAAKTANCVSLIPERRCVSIATFPLDVLGYLVQLLADKPFDEYLREHIFEPLAMPDTGFHIRDDQLDRFAACYQRN